MLSAIAAEAQIKNDEGYQQYVNIKNGTKYIGYGFNLDEEGFSREECDFILASRCKRIVAELMESFPGYNELEARRQVILVVLVYTMGVEMIMGMAGFILACREQDWKRGAEILSAHRMEKLAYQWEMDKM